MTLHQISQPIIHLAPTPAAARLFVGPLVRELVSQGIPAELWCDGVDAAKSSPAQAGLLIRHVSFAPRANPAMSLMIFARLRSLLAQLRPKAVEVHMFRSAPLALLAAYTCRIPVRIYHNHGSPFVGYRGVLRAILYTLEWVNCRLATHVLTVSDGMRNILVQSGLVQPDKCHVLGSGSACGIELSDFPPAGSTIDKAHFKRQLDIDPDTFVVLYVGRPHRRKGFHLTLAAWLARFRTEASLLLMAGISSADLAKVLPGAHPNIRALGFVDDLHSYYAAADVVALPSAHEGFGNALLEGAAWGCCLVASMIPGPDAVVHDGINGYLISPGSSAALEDALEKLARDRTLCRTLGERGRSIAARFSRKAVLADYVSYIGNLLNVRAANATRTGS